MRGNIFLFHMTYFHLSYDALFFTIPHPPIALDGLETLISRENIYTGHHSSRVGKLMSYLLECGQAEAHGDKQLWKNTFYHLFHHSKLCKTPYTFSFEG